MRPRHLLAALVVAGLSLSASQASADTDGQIWIAAALSYKPVKRLSLEFDQQLRVDKNFSRAGEILSTLGAEYRLIKWFTAGAGYRLTFARDDGEYEVQHRLHADAKFRYKLKPARFGYRIRFQERFAKNNSGETTFRHTVRNKVGVQLRFDVGLRPYLSTESFLRIAGKNGTEFLKQRITVGSTYVWGPHSFDLGYRVEVPIAEDRDTPHILLIGYGFRIK